MIDLTLLGKKQTSKALTFKTFSSSHCRKIEPDSQHVQTFRTENLWSLGKIAAGPQLK